MNRLDRRAEIESALRRLAPRIPDHELGAVVDHALQSKGLRSAAPENAAWLSLVARPTQSQALLETAGAWGWTAGLLTAAAMFAASRVAGLLRGVWLWAVWLTAATTLAAWTACRWDTGDWLGYHVLLIAHLLAAALIAVVGWLGEGRFADRNWATNLGLIASAVGIALGLRTLAGDGNSPPRQSG